MRITANKSLGVRMLLGILLFAAALTLTAILASYFYYRSETESYYRDMGRMTLHSAVVGMDTDQAEGYRASGVEDEAYLEACRQLVKIKKAHNGVSRLYMMYFTDAGGIYIYDADNTMDRNPLGTVESVMRFSEIRGAALAGRNIPFRVLDKKNGSFLTMYQPVSTAAGKFVGYMIVEIPMHRILEDQEDFVKAVSFPLLGVTLLWAILFFIWFYVRMLRPIRVLALAIQNNALPSGEEMETGDEIDGLYQLIQKREKALSGAFKGVWKQEHDALTQLYNKEKYESSLRSEYGHLASVGVVYVDINNLRLLNEKYGLSVGDIVIQKAARHVDRFLEGRAQGFRVGDDDFLMVFPGISESEFINTVQLMKDSSPVLNRSSDEVHCSLAIGYAYAAEGVRMEDVVVRAELAMSQEKQRMKGL